MDLGNRWQGRELGEHLDDWDTWFRGNVSRTELFYHAMRSKQAAQLAFLRKVAQGNYNLLALTTNELVHATQEHEGGHMPRELLGAIDAAIAHYNQHVLSVCDPAQEWRFLVKTQGHVLGILRLVNQEIDRLREAPVKVFEESQLGAH